MAGLLMWNLYAVYVNDKHIADYAGYGKWDGINHAMWHDGKVPFGRMTVPPGTRITKDDPGGFELLLPDGTRYRTEWIGKRKSENEEWIPVGPDGVIS